MSLSPSLRPARKKLDFDNGNIAYQWLVPSSAFVGGMNAARFDNFLTQARTNLNPEESLIFVYDGAPANRNPTVPARPVWMTEMKPESEEFH